MRISMMAVVGALVLGPLALAGCAADAEPSDAQSQSQSEAQAQAQSPSPAQSPSDDDRSVPKVEDGTVGIASGKIPPAQRCYNNCRRGGLRDDFCSAACGW